MDVHIYVDLVIVGNWYYISKQLYYKGVCVKKPLFNTSNLNYKILLYLIVILMPLTRFKGIIITIRSYMYE